MRLSHLLLAGALAACGGDDDGDAPAADAAGAGDAPGGGLPSGTPDIRISQRSVGAGAITIPGSMIERFWATPGQCGECPVQSLARIRRGTATAAMTRTCWNTAARCRSTPTPDGRIGAR